MLVKGRQRYCCEHLLEQAAQGSDMANFELDFGALSKHKPSDADKACYQALWQAYTEGKWDGDRDNWPKPIPDTCWDPHRRRSPHLQQGAQPPPALPFPPGRNDMDAADVLVVSHAPAALRPHHGGGIILPPPDKGASMCWTKPTTCHHSPRPRRRQPASKDPAAGWKTGRRAPAKLARTLNKESLRRPQLKLQDALASPAAGSQGAGAVARQPRAPCLAASNTTGLPTACPTLPMLAETLKEASKKALRALDGMQGAIGEALKDGESRRKGAEPCWRRAVFTCNGWRASAPSVRC